MRSPMSIFEYVRGKAFSIILFFEDDILAFIPVFYLFADTHGLHYCCRDYEKSGLRTIADNRWIAEGQYLLLTKSRNPGNSKNSICWQAVQHSSEPVAI